ncbi:uncharacterized protein LOC118434277 isoform X1 [Folsomia candida]|uniref:uncharacterized protein LOC118434277 isoform X1 n=1 Tax=Folsomia candida TaxID=158441 RepID=UPI0016052E8D|nr:uncharacterized protein LOC118434277 isoform X1 [Folsomia candida]
MTAPLKTPTTASSCMKQWEDPIHLTNYYKTEACKKFASRSLCDYTHCPFYHGKKERRRSFDIYSYTSQACEHVKLGEEWKDSTNCPNKDECTKCHTRMEQQFHPEVYKKMQCKDLQTGACPRGTFCAFAHNDFEIQGKRSPEWKFDWGKILPAGVQAQYNYTKRGGKKSLGSENNEGGGGIASNIVPKPIPSVKNVNSTTIPKLSSAGSSPCSADKTKTEFEVIYIECPKIVEPLQYTFAAILSGNKDIVNHEDDVGREAERITIDENNFGNLEESVENEMSMEVGSTTYPADTNPNNSFAATPATFADILSGVKSRSEPLPNRLGACNSLCKKPSMELETSFTQLPLPNVISTSNLSVIDNGIDQPLQSECHSQQSDVFDDDYLILQSKQQSMELPLPNISSTPATSNFSDDDMNETIQSECHSQQSDVFDEDSFGLTSCNDNSSVTVEPPPRHDNLELSCSSVDENQVSTCKRERTLTEDYEDISSPFDDFEDQFPYTHSDNLAFNQNWCCEELGNIGPPPGFQPEAMNYQLFLMFMNSNLWIPLCQYAARYRLSREDLFSIIRNVEREEAMESFLGNEQYQPLHEIHATPEIDAREMVFFQSSRMVLSSGNSYSSTGESSQNNLRRINFKETILNLPRLPSSVYYVSQQTQGSYQQYTQQTVEQNQFCNNNNNNSWSSGITIQRWEPSYNNPYNVKFIASRTGCVNGELDQNQDAYLPLRYSMNMQCPNRDPSEIFFDNEKPYAVNRYERFPYV